MMESLIRTDKLSKYYGKGGQIKAVDELDLEVHEGDRSIMKKRNQIRSIGRENSSLLLP